GFKSSTVSFADVYANSRVGLGVQVAAVNQNFGIGTISNTGGQFDMAIDGDRGLFRVVDASGQVMYSRNGAFSANKEGYLVNPQGYFLTGYVGESTTPERIRVPYGNIAPKATEGITMAANFNANAPLNETLGVLYEDPATAGDDPIPHYFRMDGGNYVWVDAAGNPAPAPAGAGGTIVSNGVTVTFDGTGQPDDVTGTEFTAYTPRPDFDPAVAGSYTHSLPITVYDSLGNSHQLV